MTTHNISPQPDTTPAPTQPPGSMLVPTLLLLFVATAVCYLSISLYDRGNWIWGILSSLMSLLLYFMAVLMIMTAKSRRIPK